MDPEERARLLAIAYGSDAEPAARAAARRALSRTEGATTPVAAAVQVAPQPPGPEPDPEASSGSGTTPFATPGAEHAPTSGPGRPRRSRLRLAALIAGTAVAAAALGAGGSMLAARLGPTVVASQGGPGGTGVRIGPTLTAARTGEDRLPSTMAAGVDRSSTHLVFETYPGTPPIRWRVWVATAQGGAEICFVVAPDDSASDVTCTSRTEALDGVVEFVTRDGGEGLSVRDDHGIVGSRLLGAD